MKNKYLASIMAVLMVSTAVLVLACQCAFADCGRAVKINAARCHHETSETARKTPSGNRCCGKCQLEKAAVLSEKSFSLDQARSGKGTPETALLPLFFKTPSAIMLPKADLHGPPGTFFLKNIFNTSVSFRAPPQG
jgi:hypothetical protein